MKLAQSVQQVYVHTHTHTHTQYAGIDCSGKGARERAIDIEQLEHTAERNERNHEAVGKIDGNDCQAVCSMHDSMRAAFWSIK